MGEREELRRKVLKDLLKSPLTLLPVAGGLTALMAGWALGGGALLYLLGGLGVAGGVGTFFTRLFTDAERLVKKALDEQAQAERGERDAELDALHRKLLNDKDNRTQQLLKDLRTFERRLSEGNEEGLLAGMNAASRQEIEAKVKRLVAACIASLHRSVELWAQAEKTFQTQAREDLLEEREREIQEVTVSLQAIATIAKQRIEEGGEEQRQTNLADLRQELTRSLDVAKKVDERMKALDRELTSDAYQALEDPES